MIKKKNGFLTFICSLIPGAAEMYMGFMKQGLSLMILFFSLFYIGVIWEGGTGAVLLFDMVVWFYSFFHAQNLYAAPDEVFAAIEDKLLFPCVEDFSDEKVHIKGKGIRLLIAWGLILVGVTSLWQIVSRYLYNMNWIPDWVYWNMRRAANVIPQLAISIIIIYIGIQLLKAKKTELSKEPQAQEAAEKTVMQANIEKIAAQAAAERTAAQANADMTGSAGSH